MAEDSRTYQITKMLKDQRDLADKLFKALGSEAISYELIRGDLEALRAKRQKLMDENKIIEMQNLEARKVAEKIVAAAQVDADKIKSTAREKLMDANRELEKAKEASKGEERRILKLHIEQLTQKAEALSA